MPTTRELVVSALETFGKSGATVDDLIELIGKDLGTRSARSAVSASLTWMKKEGLVVESDGCWTLTKFAESAEESHAVIEAYRYQDRPSDARPAQSNWAGQTIALHYEPRIISGVVTVKVSYWDNPDKWHPLGLFTNIRIYIGKTVPDWSPRRLVYRNVRVLHIEYKNPKQPENNRVEEFDVSKTCLVTIDELTSDELTDR